ncbi:MAG: ATP-binding protein [Bacteroidetes bacterium]|nr:ATP-binding protein [Bacteroidota bacterium]MCY4234113.1 ATP-binding protein [Bacteroidota bacterium]
MLNHYSIFSDENIIHDLLPTVVIMGAESTGKTTLAEALAVHYNTAWVEEYLRLFVAAKGDVPIESDVYDIAQGHLDLVAKKNSQAYRVLFLDTDLYTTCVYQRIYFGQCPLLIERAARQYQSKLYLFTEPDIPWVADPGQRSGPDERLSSHKLLLKEARLHSLNMVAIQGTHEDRLTTSIKAVNHTLMNHI